MRITTIQNSMIRAFALIVVFTIVLLGAFSLYFFKKTLTGNVEQTTMQFVAQLNRVIENYITYMDDIALVVMNNADVKSYMAGSRTPAWILRSRIESFLKSIRTVRKDIDSVFLLRKDGGLITEAPSGIVNGTINVGEKYRELSGRLLPGRALVSSAHVENIIDDRYPWVISLVRQTRDGDSSEGTGAIQVNLNYEIIADLCRNIQLGLSGYVFIVDGTGDIVYHPRQQLVYGGLKTELIADIISLRGRYLYAEVDGRDILYTAVPSSQTGWTVVAVSFLDELFSGMREAEYYFLMLAILCFSVAVAVSWYISMRISKPIESLRKSMQEVENGNFDIDITVKTKNEIFRLAQDCNIAVKKVRDLILQNKTEHELKRKLELRTLQAQINPHFLYNALDSIIWMIELGESTQAIEMTSSLAKFFRLGVNRGGEIISVGTEVEYLESYLTIQKIRYKKKLEYSILVPADLLEFKILKLLIQPLVENSIYHGIKNKDGAGFLQVTGERSGGTLVFRISDNGTGMPPERLETLRRSLDEAGGEGDSPASGASGSVGVGIRNVQDRIRLYFGPQYGIDFESFPGRGTTATIRIPVLREEGQ